MIQRQGTRAFFFFFSFQNSVFVKECAKRTDKCDVPLLRNERKQHNYLGDLPMLPCTNLQENEKIPD